MPTIHLSGGSQGPRNRLIVFLPGATVLGLGLLILLQEELLRYLVAGFFIAVGLMLLAAAAQLKHGGMTARWMRSMQDRFQR